MFYFNVPISGLAFLIAVWKLREDTKPRHPVALPTLSTPAAPAPVQRSIAQRLKHFDWIGAVIFLVGIFLLLSAIVNAAIPSMPTKVMIIFFAVGG